MAGPERPTSAPGVPVPSNTTRVRPEGSGTDGEASRASTPASLALFAAVSAGLGSDATPQPKPNHETTSPTPNQEVVGKLFCRRPISAVTTLSNTS